MNMSDDVSGAVVGMSTNVAQKGIEVGQKTVNDAIDNVAKLLQALFTKRASGQGEVTSSNMTDIKPGEVGIDELITNARKDGDTVVSTDGYSKADMKLITKKCEEFGIPVAFTNKKDADNICAHVRGSEKSIFERISTDIIKDKLADRPQELDNFKAERWEIDGIHRELSKHDLNANWGKTKDGEYFCLFEKTDRKAVLMARSEFIRKCGEVENDLTITKDNEHGMFTLTDEKSGKEISFDDIPSKNELSETFQSNFGYDENKAEIACGKFGETQLDGADKREFFSDNPQNEFSKIENHIELKGENILVKDYDCLRVTPKADGVPCLVFRDENNNFAVLNPEKMTRAEMAETFRSSLGITDEKTISALVDKADKVNDFYAKQDTPNFAHSCETVNDTATIRADIERIDKDNFKVESFKHLHDPAKLNTDSYAYGSKVVSSETLVLSFSDKKKALSELQKMYESQGISPDVAKQSAKEVFSKAQSQSAEKVLQIEEIKVDKTSLESHGVAKNEAQDAVMTVKYGSQSEKIDLTDREKTLSEIGDKFDVSEKEAEKLLEKAQDKTDLELKTSKSKDAANPLNNHEKTPTEAVKLDNKAADIPKGGVANAKPDIPAPRGRK